MALAGSFGFVKKVDRPYGGPANFYVFSQCITSTTEQLGCETTNTGAQCTILFEGTHYPAWQYMTGPVKNCTVPIRRSN
jgi:hypothetical protein